MPPKISLLKLTQTEAIKKLYENNHVIQDMLVPMETFADSVRFFKRNFNVFPLWLCPFILPANAGMVHPKGDSAEFYVDIGMYGVPKVDNFHPEKSTRKVEKYVTDVNG